MDNEQTWRGEAISWHATDLYEMGYVKSEDEWNEFCKLLCDTVQIQLEGATNG
jgi:hypothetical protein